MKKLEMFLHYMSCSKSIPGGGQAVPREDGDSGVDAMLGNWVE